LLLVVLGIGTARYGKAIGVSQLAHLD